MILYLINFSNEFKRRDFQLKKVSKDKYQLETKCTEFGRLKVLGYKNSKGYHFIIANPDSLCIGKILSAVRCYGLEWISEEFEDEQEL